MSSCVPDNAIQPRMLGSKVFLLAIQNIVGPRCRIIQGFKVGKNNSPGQSATDKITSFH